MDPQGPRLAPGQPSPTREGYFGEASGLNRPVSPIRVPSF